VSELHIPVIRERAFQRIVNVDPRERENDSNVILPDFRCSLEFACAERTRGCHHSTTVKF
jgi:hypothetical protein